MTTSYKNDNQQQNFSGVVADSLNALLHALIDYAGLFPPASLDFDTAVRNYARYRRSEDRWMLGPFISPAAHINDLTRYADLLTADATHPLAVLGPGSETADEFVKGLAQVRESIDLLRERIGNIAVPAAIEIKIPHHVAASTHDRNRTLSQFYSLFESDHHSFDFFVEVVPFAEPDIVLELSQVLRRLDEADGRERAALKVRTGGITPDAVPKPSALAGFICACRDARVRFKATAGLHHPLRHYSTDVGADMHGFLNVFAGAITAHQHGLTPDRLSDILLIENTEAFRFDDTGMTVDGLFVPSDEIRALRKSFAMSFGSCSFDEPREDLTALGLL